MPASERAAAAARVAGKWQPGASGDAAALGVLLAAGAEPWALLPRLLLRYEWSVQVAQQHPFHKQPNGWRAGLAACLAHPACQGRSCCTPEQRCQLLLAAICCRDASLCSQLIAGAEGACWERHVTNCHLLVAAAEHNLPAVLSALLALRMAGGGQPFSLGMSHEGCSALAAAAERSSCAALRLLLAHGAAANSADDDGLSALHWAVIGGAYEAAELLLQAGASPNQPCSADPNGLHLERPLLTAIKEGHLPLVRLLLAHGAALAAPTERGCTPLSVAVACERVEAARLLLGLGADAQQVLPLELNGGRFRDASLPASAPQPPSSPPANYDTLLGLAASRRGQAGPLLDLLLAAGASPAPAQAADVIITPPLVEATMAGGVEGAAHLLRWAAQRGLPLLRLGWAAAATAAARRCLASDRHHELLCLLLDAWQAQQEAAQHDAAQQLPAAECAAIVSALLAAHTQQQTQHIAAAQPLDTASQLHAVLLAERCSELGICADFSESLPTAPHNRCVILAALLPAKRWGPRTHRYRPAPFKSAARQLLLAAARQQRELSRVPAGKNTPGGASLASLPPHLIQHIIQLASNPVSFWLSHSKG
ncbi:hypothetical protein ABPG75_004318 [Micractinium tetrahymenae]